MENPKVSTQKPPKLINEFSKVAEYKINIEELVSLLYTNNEISEKECKQTIPFKIASKKVKYLGINLAKEVKDICWEPQNNNKGNLIWFKEMENYPMLLNWKN